MKHPSSCELHKKDDERFMHRKSDFLFDFLGISHQNTYTPWILTEDIFVVCVHTLIH